METELLLHIETLQSSINFIAFLLMVNASITIGFAIMYFVENH